MDISGYHQEHQELVKHVQEISGMLNDTAGNAKKILDTLIKMSASLKIHLAKEDNHLYPQFAKCGDAAVEKMASDFQKEMGSLKDTWTEFSGNWRTEAKIQENADEFKNTISAIFKALAARVEKEEKTLYPAFERL